MKIGLDYDGTYTSDPALWQHVVGLMLARGHSVHVVTMRYPQECFGPLDKIDPDLVKLIGGPEKVVCTGGRTDPWERDAKLPTCQSVGVAIDVWIDDNPRAVYESANQIWGDRSVPGNVVVPQYN